MRKVELMGVARCTALLAQTLPREPTQLARSPANPQKRAQATFAKNFNGNARLRRMGQIRRG
jgi:hypothetical protein